MPEIVELVKEELLDRTNFDCKYFCSTGYSKYADGVLTSNTVLISTLLSSVTITLWLYALKSLGLI